MRNIAIIGSGLAGLVCAHGLRKAGHSVTVYSDRTPDDWLSKSRPTGAAARFWPALDYERELGLDHWRSSTAKFDGVHLTLCPVIGNRLLTCTGRMSQPGETIDMRLQCHRWMHDLVDRGGKIEIEEVTIPKLEEIARAHDLTLVATGKGGLASLFQRNAPRSVHRTAQRNVCMVFFKGPSYQLEGLPFQAVKYKIIGTHGEIFWLPYHHKDEGPVWVVAYEAKPGGPMDRFGHVKSTEELLDVSKKLMKELFPWEYDWLKDAEPVKDELGWLVGGVTPTVREPVGRLPSGQVVMPLGDTAIAVDPIAAQGANGGNRMARHVVNAITARGDRPFDEAWITETFESLWSEYAKYAVGLSNKLLEPPTPMLAAYLVAQYGSDGRAHRTDGAQTLANQFAENLADPRTLTPVLLEDAKIRSHIRATMGSFVRTVAKTVPRLLRAQVRQRLGRDPGHPLVMDGAAAE